MEPLTLIYAALSCWPPELAEAALPTVVVDSVVVEGQSYRRQQRPTLNR